MREFFRFKSIYAKFAIIFLMIWWFLNAVTFAVILRVLTNSQLIELIEIRIDLFNEVYMIRNLIERTFFISSITGTICILIAVRSIVKPIKKLSIAAKDVAKGNFDIQIESNSIDEIGQLTTDFNSMTKELKNIEILRKDFVSNVSHEFKTPITSIKGFAKLIRDEDMPREQVEEYSDIIVHESERLALLSSNLLKISELDSQVIREQAQVFSLDEQIRKTILLLEVYWTKKNIEFDIELEEIMYKGDEHLLQQVWINLIQNAIKFSNENGHIRVGLHKNGDSIVAYVKDYGIGIDEKEKERIFERFYKGDQSRSSEGNGLGLVIVKKIVALSNGKINFESELGKGSTFIVELPS
jgi:signal transduction histidine kinase